MSAYSFRIRLGILSRTGIFEGLHGGDFFLRNRSFITSPLINYLVRGEEAWNLISTTISFSYLAVYFRRTVVLSEYKQRDCTILKLLSIINLVRF
jgi:hypothetical protein